MASSSNVTPLTARRDESLAARITQVFPLPGVRAGSALVAWRGRLLAIQDDALAAVWIDPVARTLEPCVLSGAGGAMPKATKPDFEAAFLHQGGIWILGSGGKPARRRIARLQFGGSASVSLHDAAPLYAALEAALGMPPNIEGAIPGGERLRLLHRGPGRTREASAILDVALDELLQPAPVVRSVQPCNLGRLDGLALAFTDAAPLAPGRVLYLAVAEDTPDGIADGPVAGAVVGVLAGSTAGCTPLLEVDGSFSRRKVEGVALDPDRAGGWLLTDPDDAECPAELCRVELKGFL